MKELADANLPNSLMRESWERTKQEMLLNQYNFFKFLRRQNLTTVLDSPRSVDIK